MIIRTSKGEKSSNPIEYRRSVCPANSPAVSDGDFTVLGEELGKGPSVHGFEDER